MQRANSWRMIQKPQSSSPLFANGKKKKKKTQRAGKTGKICRRYENEIGGKQQWTQAGCAGRC